jgi:DNA-binding LacI/PurR family transcriptional regulator
MDRKRMGIKEIAEALSLSPTTVSRALSGNGRVSEDTRKRIAVYLDENEAVPTVHRLPYTAKKTKNILVTVAGESDFGLLPFFSQAIISTYDYFQPLGYQVMIAKTNEQDIEPLKKIIKQHKCDGVILTRTLENAIDIGFLQERGVPFVTIGSYDDGTVYQVDVDQQRGCRDLTNHLLKSGVRRIALFCSNLKHIVARKRLKGFFQAYDDNGLDFDRRFLFVDTGYPDTAEACTETMLKEGIECILCMDDNICLNVLNALRKFEVRIPRDVKVASFYNSRVLEEYYPPISCVSLDIRELATKAADILYQELTGKAVQRRTLLGYRVLLKESTEL